MTLTAQVSLLLTKEQQLLIDGTMATYIKAINDILDCALATDDMPKLSSANLKMYNLPSAVRDQVRLDAKSIWKTYLKGEGKFPTLKKPKAIWNNQNYRFQENDTVEVPVMINGKSKRIPLQLNFHDKTARDGFYNLIKTHALGTLRITKKNDKYVAQLAYDKVELPPVTSDNIMGIDVGIKCPAVAVDSNGRTKFYGNGRQNRYIRRKFYSRRKKLGKQKKLRAIKKFKDKEARWMKDQDHKISRAIVNDAVKQGVSIIRMETLEGIRARITYSSTTSASRKNNRSKNSWSFYRLQQDIEYKAALEGIRVEYVNPAYTSQICPHCGVLNKANDRLYTCSACGYTTHRDRLGAINVRDREPELTGTQASA